MAEAAIETLKVRDLDKETAGIVERQLAALIDNLLVAPLIIIILLIPAITGGANRASLDSVLYDMHRWQIALPCIIVFAYGAILLSRYGRTFGMMALKIRVTNLDGSDIDSRRAVLRGVAYCFPSFLLIFFASQELPCKIIEALTAIGLLWIMVDRAHQGYHDKIAKTLVMREKYYRQRQTAFQPQLDADLSPTI